MSRYYRLTWDSDFEGPWSLGKVQCDTHPIDCRIFLRGLPQTPPGALQVPVAKTGHTLDFSLSAFDVPIVTSKVGDTFSEYDPNGVQRLPVRVAATEGNYEVLNITQTVDVLDLHRGKYLWWRAEDGRPEKVGALRSVYEMVFRPDIHPPPHVFRIKGWEIALVVSRALMEALGGPRLRGVRFLPIEQ